MALKQPLKLKFDRKLKRITFEGDPTADYFTIIVRDQQDDIVDDAQTRLNTFYLSTLTRWSARIEKGEWFKVFVKAVKKDLATGVESMSPSNFIEFNNFNFFERLWKWTLRNILKISLIILIGAVSSVITNRITRRNISEELKVARLEALVEFVKGRYGDTQNQQLPHSSPTTTPTDIHLSPTTTVQTPVVTQNPMNTPVVVATEPKPEAQAASAPTTLTFQNDPRIPKNSVYIAKGLRPPGLNSRAFSVTNYVPPGPDGLWLITPVDWNVQIWPRANRNDYMVYANTNSLNKVRLVRIQPEGPRYDHIISYLILYTGDENNLPPEGMEVDTIVSPR